MKCFIKKCKRQILYPQYAWIYKKGQYEEIFCSRECLIKKHNKAL